MVTTWSASTTRISIHALREEGDNNPGGLPGLAVNFYPRPPRGGRRLTLAVGFGNSQISIHALREEGDANIGEQAILNKISIHALREEGDAIQVTKEQWTIYFYPRPPRGGRPLSPVWFLTLT